MDVVSAINGCAGRGRDLGESVAKSVMGVVCARFVKGWDML